METAAQFHFSSAGLGLEDHAIAQFQTYLDLLLKWNARMNLTAIRDPQDIARRHFAECIFAAQLIPKQVKTLLDYGSGAGFPGIPFAICHPEVSVTLAESQGKKTAFLREAVRTLCLTAEVWPWRVEQMIAARIFDMVALRAVDRMADACTAALERLTPAGYLLVFATRGTEETLDRTPQLYWDEGTPIPGTEHGIIKLGSKDPKSIPRKPKTPRSRPVMTRRERP